MSMYIQVEVEKIHYYEIFSTKLSQDETDEVLRIEHILSK